MTLKSLDGALHDWLEDNLTKVDNVSSVVAYDDQGTFLVHRMIEEIGDVALDGPTGIAEARYSFIFFSPTRTGAVEAAKELQEKLHGYNDDMEGVQVCGAFLVSAYEDFERGKNLYRREQEYLIRFKEV